LRRVAELFKDHADLLRGFTYFLPDNPEEDGMETFHVDASTVEIPAASLADLERDLREAKARYSNATPRPKRKSSTCCVRSTPAVTPRKIRGMPRRMC